MAEESADRCYHSVALLLPDGRVLSAGGGEYPEAKPKDCLTNAQLFSPPYLFKGPRPVIANAPSEIVYGTKFDVTLGSAMKIEEISWIRLGSVTHCRNMGQSLMWLKGSVQRVTNLTIPAPASANLAPPGHYMLFVLNQQRVPSVARIIRISPPPPAPTPVLTRASRLLTRAPAQVLTRVSRLVTRAPAAAPAGACVQPTLEQRNAEITSAQSRAPVTVGITALCPYGLGPCWSGAYDGLRRIGDVALVAPMANQEDSVASVYLEADVLPDLDVWRREFARTVHGSYEMRGIEMTLSGEVRVVRTRGRDEERMAMMLVTETGQELVLEEFRQESQIRWDMGTKREKAITVEEASAYGRLMAEVRERDGRRFEVTGTLQKRRDGVFGLHVRGFKAL
jgi:hypothetical protein